VQFDCSYLCVCCHCSFQVETMMETFFSTHGENQVRLKLDLTKRLASQQAIKALDTSASQIGMLEEDEKVPNL
jgi:hypothetical protein